MKHSTNLLTRHAARSLCSSWASCLISYYFLCLTRSSDIAKGPRNALCELKSRQLLHSCTKNILKALHAVGLQEQDVVLTWRNTTGPPRAAPWWVVFCFCFVLRVTLHMCRVTDDDDRHQRAKQYWPIRRASNKHRPTSAIFSEVLESESFHIAKVTFRVTECHWYCWIGHVRFTVRDSCTVSEILYFQNISWSCEPEHILRESSIMHALIFLGINQHTLFQMPMIMGPQLKNGSPDTDHAH